MEIRRIMTPYNEMACVTPGTTLPAVGKKMKETDTGVIPVVDSVTSAKLIGVITDRDGKRHQIQVKVQQRNVTVRSRTEFMVASATPVTRTGEDLVKDAMDSPVLSASLPVSEVGFKSLGDCVGAIVRRMPNRPALLTAPPLPRCFLRLHRDSRSLTSSP